MTDVNEALKEALQSPSDYYGAIPDLQQQGWALVFGRSRDSDNLEISNYETILERFNEAYQLNEDYRVEGSSHWAVGWVDQIMVRALDCDCEDWEEADFSLSKHNTWTGEAYVDAWICQTCGAIGRIRKIFEECVEIAGSLADYPLLDEDDYSRREHEDLLDYVQDEIGSIIRRNEDKLVEDWEPEPSQVFEYLFDVHSVCHIEDLDNGWIEDAVLAIADKEDKRV